LVWLFGANEVFNKVMHCVTCLATLRIEQWLKILLLHWCYPCNAVTNLWHCVAWHASCSFQQSCHDALFLPVTRKKRTATISLTKQNLQCMCPHHSQALETKCLMLNDSDGQWQQNLPNKFKGLSNALFFMYGIHNSLGHISNLEKQTKMMLEPKNSLLSCQ